MSIVKPKLDKDTIDQILELALEHKDSDFERKDLVAELKERKSYIWKQGKTILAIAMYSIIGNTLKLDWFNAVNKQGKKFLTVFIDKVKSDNKHLEVIFLDNYIHKERSSVFLVGSMNLYYSCGFTLKGVKYFENDQCLAIFNMSRKY